jgi:hypothetical protein
LLIATSAIRDVELAPTRDYGVEGNRRKVDDRIRQLRRREKHAGLKRVSFEGGNVHVGEDEHHVLRLVAPVVPRPTVKPEAS